MIEIVYTEGGYAPRVYCDFCDECIEQDKDGNFESRLPNVGEEGEVSRRYAHFTHKRCSDAFRRSRGGNWGCQELKALPLLLENNLGINHEEVIEWRCRMAGLP